MGIPAGRSSVAEAARECRALRHAHVLAEWVGNGKPVTGKGVLRRVDVAPASREIGVAVPDRVRSAADVPDLHRPWTVALELGLLSISDRRAVPGPAVASWPPVTDEEVLESWSRGLVTVLAVTFAADVRAEAWELGRIALSVLTTDPVPGGEKLLDTIQHTAGHTSDEVFVLILRGFGSRHPAAIALGILSTFGAVTDDEQHPALTGLGRWALTEITSRSAALSSDSPAESELDAGTVCQLVIALQRVRPSCWRRVLVPPTATLGDNWLHKITLEDTQQLDPQAAYPTCTGGRGNSPMEDWNGEGPDSSTYDQARINTRLATLHHREHHRDQS